MNKTFTVDHHSLHLRLNQTQFILSWHFFSKFNLIGVESLRCSPFQPIDLFSKLSTLKTHRGLHRIVFLRIARETIWTKWFIGRFSFWVFVMKSDCDARVLLTATKRRQLSRLNVLLQSFFYNSAIGGSSNESSLWKFPFKMKCKYLNISSEFLKSHHVLPGEKIYENEENFDIA